MPVLAWGGSSATGDRLRSCMESLAFHVEGGAIEECGHYVMEERPETITARLLGFFEKVEARP